MSNNNQFSGGQRNNRFFLVERKVDIISAYRKRIAKLKPNTKARNKKGCDDIPDIAKSMQYLLKEYAVTAKRVGTVLDATFYLKVVGALQRESLGEPDPLKDFQTQRATEYFFAKSLYGELLEFQSLARPSNSDGCASFQSLADWNSCLDLLADSLPKTLNSDLNAN